MRTKDRLKVTPSIREDTVFLPFHWAGAQSANLLTNAALDPTSKMPEFKVCAARIDKFVSGEFRATTLSPARSR